MFDVPLFAEIPLFAGKGFGRHRRKSDAYSHKQIQDVLPSALGADVGYVTLSNLRSTLYGRCLNTHSKHSNFSSWRGFNRRHDAASFHL